MADGGGDDVEFTMTVRDDETELVMTGQKDAAVVVRSASGEQIYIPPEDFHVESDDSPYQSARDDSPYQSARDDSPYQSARDDSPYQSTRDDSPYQSARDDSPYQSARGGQRRVGMTPTADGFRIVHPEPVTDVRVLR